MKKRPKFVLNGEQRYLSPGQPYITRKIARQRFREFVEIKKRESRHYRIYTTMMIGFFKTIRHVKNLKNKVAEYENKHYGWRPKGFVA